ncbi:MAPK organizer 1 [Intoshia linei]|uniref:WD repeat domain-containing protein 83 n=1 Tax=Intoshia linei TaxID=1819745 RepID=A0A177AXJ7_9BILA|nr:MAPK organizer 1 [Intoshia linei]
MENYKLVHQFKCNQGAVRAVNHNFDGKYCLTAGSNTTIKLWNHEKGNLLKTYSGHGQDVMDVRGSRDNSKIVSASKDKTVFLWDVLTGKSIKRYRYHAASVNNAQFNFYDNTIISASVDASVALWDLRTSSMKPMSVIKDARDTIVSLDVYDTIICYGSADGWVRINDIRMGLMMADCIGGKTLNNCTSSCDCTNLCTFPHYGYKCLDVHTSFSPFWFFITSIPVTALVCFLYNRMLIYPFKQRLKML